MAYIIGAGSRSEDARKNHDFVCLHCGDDLGKGEPFCPGCGRENPGYLPEADKKIPWNAGKSAARVRKEARVARKKKARKARITCPNPNCGRAIKRKYPKCPACSTPNPYPSAKALKAAVAAQVRVAYLNKARMDAGAAWCLNGHQNRPGGRFCATCLEVMPGQPVPDVRLVQSDPAADNYYAPKMAYHHDPAVRNLYHLYKYGNANGGPAA